MGSQKVGHNWVTNTNTTLILTTYWMRQTLKRVMQERKKLASRWEKFLLIAKEIWVEVIELIKKTVLVGRKWYSALKDSSRFSLPSYCISLLSEIMTNLDSVLKSRDITLSTKVHRVQVIYIYIYIFPVVMYGWKSWEIKKGWMPENWCLRTLVLEKTLESPLDCKEIKLVNPKGNQSCIFIGRTNAEAETPILWPPDAKSWLTGKDPDAGKDWGRRRRDDRGWDGWMATQWTWVWASSGSWWWTGKPGRLQSMGLQRVGHNRTAIEIYRARYA